MVTCGFRGTPPQFLVKLLYRKRIQFTAIVSYIMTQLMSFLGCSYLYEVQNEVHNNSSLEIYYQVFKCYLTFE